MSKWLLFIVFVMPCFSCTSNKIEQDTVPACIESKILELKNDPRQNSVRSVTEFKYNGKKVFYIVMPCCDQMNMVYDDQCNYLGSPDGGFTGKGDGKLPGFFSNVTGKKIIWDSSK